jgi:CheY-like chemotaxis protein
VPESGRSGLRVLVADQDSVVSDVLVHELRANQSLSAVELATSVPEVVTRLHSGTFDIIFIDPLSLGLDEATNFIFSTRDTLPHIVFVLFIDMARAEHRNDDFYSGPRTRFLHYFKLDKRTPVATFRNEIDTALERCLLDMRLMGPVQRQLEDIRIEASNLADSAPEDAAQAIHELSAKLDDLLERLPASPGKTGVRSNSVFLSCRFADSQYVDGLRELLEVAGFEVITGDNASGYISQTILERIREAEFFICLMTRDKEKTDGTYTTSPWLLEEKGAALAFGKYLVLLVEEGVTDYGGLQGDWQRHHFGAKGFTGAALKAVRQLRSASGGTVS